MKKKYTNYEGQKKQEKKCVDHIKAYINKPMSIVSIMKVYHSN